MSKPRITSSVSHYGSHEKWAPYVFLMPTLVLFVTIFAFPVGFVIYSSLFKWSLLDPQAGQVFVGLMNFANLLTDERFWHSMGVTVRYVLAVVPVELVLGLLIAILFNRPFRFKKTLQGVLLSPMMVAPVALLLAWKILLEPTYGIANALLGRLGFEPYPWLSGQNSALVSVELVEIWQNTPFVFLVLFAALQTVPQEPIESALVDGVNPIQLYRHVILPSIKPVFLVVAVMRVMDAIRAFDSIYVLTGGGPANSTRTVQFMDYELAFKSMDIGRGSALGIIIVVCILLVGSLMIREMNRSVSEL